MNFVIDASVAAKFLISEADTPKAVALVRDWQEGRTQLRAPAILPAEVASVLWKKTKTRDILAQEATALYLRFSRIGIPLAPVEELTGRALDSALLHGHSVYDGLYLALSLATGWDLITADEKLFRAFSPIYPQIRLLRDWTPEPAG